MLSRLAAATRRGAPRLARAFADEPAAGADAGAASRAAFLDKIRPLLSSTSAPPNFPSDFAAKAKAGEAADAAPAAGVPDKLTFSFYLPHGQPMDREPVRRVGGGWIGGGCCLAPRARQRAPRSRAARPAGGSCRRPASPRVV